MIYHCSFKEMIVSLQKHWFPGYIMDHIVVWMILTILLHILMELHDTLPCLRMFFKKQDILRTIT